MGFHRSPKARKWLIRIYECPLPGRWSPERVLDGLRDLMGCDGYVQCGVESWYNQLDPENLQDRVSKLRVRGVFVGVEKARQIRVHPASLIVAYPPPGTEVFKVSLLRRKR